MKKRVLSIAGFLFAGVMVVAGCGGGGGGGSHTIPVTPTVGPSVQPTAAPTGNTTLALPACANGSARTSNGLCQGTTLLQPVLVQAGKSGAVLQISNADQVQTQWLKRGGLGAGRKPAQSASPTPIPVVIVTPTPTPGPTATPPPKPPQPAYVIGFDPSVGVLGAENCWSYTQSASPLGFGSAMSATISQSQFSSDLGIQASVGVKISLFEASDTAKFAASVQSNSEQVGIVYQNVNTTHVTNSINGVLTPGWGAANGQTFGNACGSAMLTSYNAQTEVLVGVTLASTSSTVTQSISNDFSTHVGSFASAMASVSANSSASASNTTVSITYLALNAPLSAQAALDNALTGPNYTNCITFVNTAQSCAGLTAQINAALGTIATTIQSNLASGTANYLYPAFSGANALVVNNIGNSVNGVPLTGTPPPTNVPDPFASIAPAAQYNGLVLGDMQMLSSLASTYGANLYLGPGIPPTPYPINQHGPLQTLNLVQSQYAGASNTVVGALNSCFSNPGGCTLSNSSGTNCGSSGASYSGQCSLWYYSIAGGPAPTCAAPQKGIQLLTNQYALSNAFLWADNFEISDLNGGLSVVPVVALFSDDPTVTNGQYPASLIQVPAQPVPLPSPWSGISGFPSTYSTYGWMLNQVPANYTSFFANVTTGGNGGYFHNAYNAYPAVYEVPVTMVNGGWGANPAAFSPANGLPQIQNLGALASVNGGQYCNLQNFTAGCKEAWQSNLSGLNENATNDYSGNFISYNKGDSSTFNDTYTEYAQDNLIFQTFGQNYPCATMNN